MCLSLPILFCLLTVWFCRCSCLCCCLKGEAPQPRPSCCPAHCCLLTLPNEQQHKKRNRLDGFAHTHTHILCVCVTELTVVPVWSFPGTKRRSLIVIFLHTLCVDFVHNSSYLRIQTGNLQTATTPKILTGECIYSCFISLELTRQAT